MSRAVMRLTPSHTQTRPQLRRSPSLPAILDLVIPRRALKRIFVMTALLAFVLAACHKKSMPVKLLPLIRELAEKKFGEW